MMSFAAAAPSAGPAKVEDDDEGGQTVVAKTSYAVKLLKFADGKKIDLIKEVKNITTGMNLVQAKKFVESLPQTVKTDISKDEAEKLKQKLESLGGECEIA
uniref:Ribosomal protein L7/L12 C-terminal domain-containing protein n=2 Tax=Romanomermis culicivorax TaxID=13658 RepID=A0A915JD10_ROMCU